MTKPSTRPTYAGAIQIAVATFLVGLLSPAAATNTTGTCQTARAKFVANDTFRSTASTTYVNVPGTAVTFTQGTANTCVIVYFFGLVGTDADTQFFLIATIDGVAGFVGGATQLTANSTSSDARGTSFIFPNIAPGSHIARIQFHGSGGGSAYIYSSNVIVHYAP